MKNSGENECFEKIPLSIFTSVSIFLFSQIFVTIVKTDGYFENFQVFYPQNLRDHNIN